MKPPRAALSVEPGMNGGVEIEGWDTDSIAVTARIQVNAHSADEADAIARDIKIEASGATIRAIGGSGPVATPELVGRVHRDGAASYRSHTVDRERAAGGQQRERADGSRDAQRSAVPLGRSEE